MARPRNPPTARPPGTRAQNTRQALKEKTNTTRANAKSSAEGEVGSNDFGHATKKRRTTEKGDEQDASVLATSRKSRAAKETSGTRAEGRKTGKSNAQANAIPAGRVATAKIQDKAASSPNVRVPPPSSPVPDQGPGSFDLNSQPTDFSPSPSPPPAAAAAKQQSKQRPSVPRHSLFQPGSALRNPEASTAAAENSLLALRNFKRRPRQPSMLQMVQQRRASAQPSAIGNSGLAADSLGLGLGGEDEIEDLDDDFRPEAAGTPAHMGRMKRLSVASRRDSSENSRLSDKSRTGGKNRKRSSGQASSFLPEPDEATRKRPKTSTPQPSHARSSTSALSSLHSRSQSTRPDPSPVVLIENSQPEETFARPPSSPLQDLESDHSRASLTRSTKQTRKSDTQPPEAHEEQSENDDLAPDDTLADPVSSSPAPVGTHVSATQQTDIFADPATQISPPRPTKSAKTRQKATARPLSTSTLQALLPKRRQPVRERRQRRRTEYDLPSSSVEASQQQRTHGEEDSDEDELSGHVAPQSRRDTVGKKGAKAKPSKSTGRGKAKGRKALSSVNPAAAKRSDKSRKSTQQQLRTYARNNGTDKENGNRDYENDGDFASLPDEENDSSLLPDTSLTMHEAAAQSEELAEARRKFADVDDWEMEFESVSRHEEDGRSSSQLWR